jgi:sec-independent protein translocase protein TatA
VDGPAALGHIGSERCALVGDIGWQELLIIFVILLLLFGATRLPALSKSLGQSIRGFKQGLKDDEPAPGDSVATTTTEGEEKSAQA